MIKKKSWILVIFFFLILLLSCTNKDPSKKSESSVELPPEGVEIADAWARPGRSGGTSAIYMKMLNGSFVADTVLSMSSPAAGMVEIHETYEREEGMVGMRPAQDTTIPPRGVVDLEPGGLHIMLMQLNRNFVEGDEIELTIQFAKAGEVNVTAPVQSMSR